MTKASSLRLRLTLLFAIIAIIVWLIAGAISYALARHSLNEVFDTQQTLFAKSLASTDLETLLRNAPLQLPETKQLIRHGDRGKNDDDVLAFAIFDTQGKMLLHDGENGEDFVFDPHASGFVKGYLRNDDDPWRLLYLPSNDQRFHIVVGQELEYRQDLAMQLLLGQLLPWLIALPFLMLAIAWLTGRELASLHTVSQALTVRHPDDDAPITSERIPLEVQPLIKALNTLFKRTNALLTRERRFTADAAHELRTPLAALRVQAEVARMADDDRDSRNHALDQLMLGIDRATRLIEQLLALSRLDPLTAPAESTPIDWRALAHAAYRDAQVLAETHNVTLSLVDQETPPSLNGSPALLTLLLRNLLDNAIRYTPEGSHVSLALTSSGLYVEDNGPGVAPEYLSKISQRFFRPPGQSQPGSGLGLSIAERIANLHGLTLHLENRKEGGFMASLRFP